MQVKHAAESLKQYLHIILKYASYFTSIKQSQLQLLNIPMHMQLVLMAVTYHGYVFITNNMGSSAF